MDSNRTTRRRRIYGAFTATAALGLALVAGAREPASATVFCPESINGWGTKLVGSTDLDSITAVAPDAAGCALYAAGSTWGVIAGAANQGLSDAFITRFSTTGGRSWSVQIGTAGNDVIHGIAVDASHNVYVVGETEGQLPGSPDPPLGDYDIFIAKFDENGNQLWLRQLGTSGYDYGSSVAVGLAGNVFLSGLASGDLGSGGYQGAWDVVLAKYDANGNPLFSRVFGTPADDVGRGMAIGSGGNVYLVGETRDDMVLYNAPGSTSDYHHGGEDLFVGKFDSATGDLIWIRQRGTTEDDGANGVAVNAENQVYVAGFAYASLDGGTHQGLSDLVLLKYTTDGDWVWTDQRGSAGGDSASAVAVDASGTPFVAGFATGSVEGQPFAGSADAVILKYGKGGALRWTREFGTSSWDSALALTILLDRAYVGGVTNGNLNGAINAGIQDGFVTRYTQTGLLF
jgi:hypothetical protein